MIMKTMYSFRKPKVYYWILTMCLITVQLSGQTHPPEIDCDQELVYKSTEQADLKLWIFHPVNHNKDKKAPAIVFFFGGGWKSGTPAQFVRHCEYLAARGMVAMVADYRVASRHQVKANSCVSDAKSAIRWVRQHAGELGIDPDRIAAGGGSAGGHLAAATGTLTKFDEPGENLDISSKPDAMILFNPALVLAPLGDENAEHTEKLENLVNRLGAQPEEMSPYHHIVPGISPTIIFHGTEDKTVPFKTVKLYTEKMQETGNKCMLVAYDKEGHSFFNYGKNNNGAFVSTVSHMDKFLVKLGWIPAPPKTINNK